MDFEEFEQLVLRVLFETDVPITAAHTAYLARVSVRTAERHLARMVEHGTLLVRTSGSSGSSAAISGAEGVVEYYYPGRKPIAAAAAAVAVGPPSITIGDPFLTSLRARPNPMTSVLLSMLIPGAGHIYAGRAGTGVAWMATTLMGYACCFLPGLFLHGLCLVSAARNTRV